MPRLYDYHMFKTKAKNVKQGGYTLLEVMLILVIIGLLSGVVLANYKLGAKRSDLQLATRLLASNLRRAEQLALSTKQENGGVIPCGYGVHFDTLNSSYFLYASKDGAETGCTSDNKIYDSGEQFESVINLPIDITFFSPMPADIFFEPPHPTVYFDGEFDVSENVKLTTDGIKITTVEVNRFGLVEVR